MEHKDAVNLIKALRNLTMEVQLFREAYVANNVHSEREIDYTLKDHCLICENALSAECTACDGDEYFSEDRTD